MKNIKYYYNVLDLPYDASEEDVIMKQKTLIRLNRAEAINNNETSNKKIDLINQSASLIVAYIRENGPMRKEEDHKISLKNEAYVLIIAILITFALVFMIL